MIQTRWADTIVATLADAGVTTCVVSPGSRSTPLVAALAKSGRIATPVVIDERSAAFYALGLARATSLPVALVCTSGSAAAHYLPAIVEASEAGVPLIAITADRPPELQHCGASQTIDQIELYGSFTRAAFDLGAPHDDLRACRRAVIQAVTASRGPRPGPVHLNVPLRKPLEPVACDVPVAAPAMIAVPRLAADPAAVAALVNRIADEPNGIVIAGACSTRNADVLALCARAGYPLLAEAGSQLRFTARAGVTTIDHFDFVLAAKLAPMPKLVIQLGAEPVAAAKLGNDVERWVIADSWRDPDGGANVILGSCELASQIPVRGDSTFTRAWREAEAKAAAAVENVLATDAGEASVIRAAIAAMPAGAQVQIGNSLPIRVVDQVAVGGERIVLTQRGAAGIDGLIASATGAAQIAPTLLIVGDVSFAHDVGSLITARLAKHPLVILVIDNAGGRIFGGLPIAKSASPELMDKFFVAAPALDVAAIANAFGIRIAHDVASAFAEAGPTVIHARVAPHGARDFRAKVLQELS
ncbi:MAG: 2-succinyl-5-enolpyruvyl-6-hydroxy-3-cyclohexene-1-carboxylic-acid synthase [Kofleriaceae bacterium]